MKLLYLYILLGIGSFALTYVIRKYAIKQKVLDIPNERSSHSIPTPRGGGLAIVICWYIGITILFTQGLMDKALFKALLSGVILAVVGIIDDIISLKPSTRMLFQTLASALAIYFIGGFQVYYFENMPQFLHLIISAFSVIGIIWFINLYNFLDGIDAYASLEAIFVAGALFYFTQSPIFVVLLVSTFGFLIWNWPKAKIFMGDVGSTQLGFILIVLGIYFHNEHTLNFTSWLVLTSLFWFDATFTLIRRIKNKEKISQAHKKHAYQRIVQCGFSHLKTSLSALVINIVVFISLILGVKLNIVEPYILILTVIMLFIVTKIIDKRFPFKGI